MLMKREFFLAIFALLASCTTRHAPQRGPVSVGMSKATAKAAWGEPMKVNRSNTGCCRIEQWRYAEGYLYFENDKLATWKYRE